MKKLFWLTMVAFPLLSIAQKNNTDLRISGKLKNISDTIDKVYLNYALNGKRVTDSSIVTNFQYVFNLTGVTNPIRVQLVARNTINKKARITPKSMATVFVEPGIVSVVSVDSFSNITVKGSQSHIEYEKLMNMSKPFDEQMTVLSKTFSEQLKNKDKEAAKKTEAEMDALDDKQRENVYGSYIKSNLTSPIALFALQRYAGYDIDADKIAPIFNKLSPSVQTSLEGIELKNRIELAKNTGIGKMAPNFTQNDTLGNPVSLASFKGKYVLIDFWASWCGPCRRENPNVVKVFNQYKDRNFTILSVSLDQPNAKDRWLQAIHDDGLTWTHVSDLQFWNNAVAKQYGIQAIPQNLLIDPNGKIVAKNLRGAELGEKLKVFINE